MVYFLHLSLSVLKFDGILRIFNNSRGNKGEDNYPFKNWHLKTTD